MKKTYSGKVFSLLILCFLAFNASGLYSQADLSKPGKGKRNFYEDRRDKLQRDGDIIKNQERTWKQFKRWEYFWEQRVYPTGEYPNAAQIYKDYKSFMAMQKKSPAAQGNQWTLIGPVNRPSSNDPATQGVGRVNVVRFHPHNPQELWIGSASGGVWRSKDFGAHWELFPFTQFLSLGVSDIMFSQSDPNTVYVATGDADGTVGSGSNFYTIGIIKTTDGGATWNVTGFSRLLSNQLTIGRLWVHPQDPNIVLAATNLGIYKTTDGGANWTSKQAGYNTIDMEQAPGDVNRLYASTFGWSGRNYILRSTDMGETWSECKKIENTIRIAIEVTPADPNYVYALASRNAGYGFHCLTISDDKGENWTDMLHYSSSRNFLGWGTGIGNDTRGQGQYDLALAVSPLDPELIFVGGVNVWKLPQMGAVQTMVGHYYGGGAPGVHADHHDLRFTPDGKRIISTNDGGVDWMDVSSNTWTSIKDGLSITQNYKIASSDEHPEIIYNGAQDNGTMGYNNGAWRYVMGGDGMDCAYVGSDPNIVFASIYYGSISKSYNGGSTFSASINQNYTQEVGAWVAPFLIHPTNKNVTYAGFYNVWRSSNTGEYGSWNKISNFGEQTPLTSLAVSASDGNVIYAATPSKVWATFNSGNSWEVIYNGSASITSLAVHPTKPKTLWITQSGFNAKNKVFEWNGETKTIKNISGNLPNIPVNALIYQKNSPDRLYIGTDIGVFYSDYNSAHWELFGEGLPNVVVQDLDISYGATPKLRAGTYGRGIWEAPLLTCSGKQPIIQVTGDTEFCKGDSIILEAKVDPYQSHFDFSWSDGCKEKVRVVKEAGDYSIQIIDPGTGCVIRSEAVFVNVIEPAQINVVSNTGKFALCGDDSELDLSASIGNFRNFKWSTGDTTRKIKITKPGDYYVSALTSDGCTVTSQTINVWRKTEFPAGEIYQRKDTIFAPEGSKFQWLYKGQEIKNATKSYYVVPDTSLGEYKVRYSDADGCTVTSAVYDFISGISDAIAGQNGIIVSPNPALDRLKVNLGVEAGSGATLRIYNAIGVKYLEQAGNGGSFEFDVTKLAPGAYFVETQVNGKRFINPFVKR